MSDSRVALAWIQSPSRSYKPFVSSRVREIQSNLEPSYWSHCPTKHNVADDITRGITIEEMNGRWLKGPKFRQTKDALWHAETESPDSIGVNKERRRIQIARPVTASEPLLSCEDFSSWRRLIRFTAHVKRFCRNLRDMSRNAHNNRNGKKENILANLESMARKTILLNRQQGKEQSKEGAHESWRYCFSNMARITISPHLPTGQSTKQ